MITSKLVLRNVGTVDVEFIKTIEDDTFSDAWSLAALNSMFDYDYYHCYVAVLKDEETEKEILMGYAIFKTVAGESELLRFALSCEQRGRGFGKSLLAYALAEENRHQTEKVFLEVRESNEAAIAVYKKQGFKEIGKRKRFYQDPEEDALLMELILNEV